MYKIFRTDKLDMFNYAKHTLFVIKENTYHNKYPEKIKKIDLHDSFNKNGYKIVLKIGIEDPKQKDHFLFEDELIINLDVDRVKDGKKLTPINVDIEIFRERINNF
jgi:hypothetical protein